MYDQSKQNRSNLANASKEIVADDPFANGCISSIGKGVLSRQELDLVLESHDLSVDYIAGVRDSLMGLSVEQIASRLDPEKTSRILNDSHERLKGQK